MSQTESYQNRSFKNWKKVAKRPYSTELNILEFDKFPYCALLFAYDKNTGYYNMLYVLSCHV